jgi:hypothetical protein
MLKYLLSNKIPELFVSCAIMGSLLFSPYAFAMEEEERKCLISAKNPVNAVMEDCPVSKLPKNVLSYIFSFLLTQDIRKISSVSKQFKKAAYSDLTWQYHNFKSRSAYFDPLLTVIEISKNKMEKTALTVGEAYEKNLANQGGKQPVDFENSLIKVTFKQPSRKRPWSDLQVK